MKDNSQSIVFTLLALALFMTAWQAEAGSLTGGANFAWNQTFIDLRDNAVTYVPGLFAVINLVSAVLAYRQGDGEGAAKKGVGALVLGGVAFGAVPILESIASSFGAVLPEAAVVTAEISVA